MPHPSQPIGIFDSGIGGLTVARSVIANLPHENIIYFGDTAHMPYGEKSTAAIQAFCVKIVNWLLEKNCKLILIACNSASAAAYHLLQEYVDGKALIVNVIDPVIHHLQEQHQGKKIGLIGTKQTIHSNIYHKKIQELQLKLDLHSHATPLLASVIEEGFQNPRITDDILAEYLTVDSFKSIDALILGCTHYPVIKEKIRRFFNRTLAIIDPSELTAQYVSGLLEMHHLLNQQGKGSRQFYVSDFTTSFQKHAKTFFNEDVHLDACTLWQS